jgi:hypothetical protein
MKGVSDQRVKNREHEGQTISEEYIQVWGIGKGNEVKSDTRTE